ncbi:MAG: hypothetical protein WA144_00285, partial [Candidatus Methanoperedens sp.]
MKKDFNSFKIFVLALIISSIPIYLFSTNSITDPFLNQHIAFAIKNIDSNNIDFSDSPLENIPSLPLLVIILSKITNIAPTTIQFMPINGFLLLLSIYSLGNRLNNSKIYSGIITILLMFSFATPYYSIWPHGIGFSLFILFILTYVRIIKNGYKTDEILLLLFILFGVHYMSYTNEMWIIGFTFSFSFLILIKKEIIGTKYDLPKVPSINFSLMCLVLFLMFNKVAFGHFLPQFESQNVLKTIDVFMVQTNYFANIQEQYLYKSPAPKVLSYLNLLYLILLSLPVSIDLMTRVRKRINNKIPILDNNDVIGTYFIYSLISVLFIDIIVYTLAGALFFRFILFIFPFFILIYISKYDLKKIIYIFLIALIITNFSIFILTWNLNERITSSSHYDELNPSADWLFIKSNNFNPITDHYTGSKY